MVIPSQGEKKIYEEKKVSVSQYVLFAISRYHEAALKFSRPYPQQNPLQREESLPRKEDSVIPHVSVAW